MSICCSTYLSAHRSLLVCVPTGDRTRNCGVSGQRSNHLHRLARVHVLLLKMCSCLPPQEQGWTWAPGQCRKVGRWEAAFSSHSPQRADITDRVWASVLLTGQARGHLRRHSVCQVTRGAVCLLGRWHSLLKSTPESWTPQLCEAQSWSPKALPLSRQGPQGPAEHRVAGTSLPFLRTAMPSMLPGVPPPC